MHRPQDEDGEDEKTPAPPPGRKQRKAGRIAKMMVRLFFHFCHLHDDTQSFSS